MSENFINVHTFDGKLKNLIDIKKYDNYYKKNVFDKLLTSLSDIYAIQTLNNITNDMYNQNGQNYQLENDLDASDILVNILTHKNFSNDLFEILNEQLSDTSKYGLCNSGRITRLLQILLSLN